MSLDWIVRPYQGLAGVAFGMTPDEVRRVLGGSFQQFKKTPQTSMLTDDFYELGMRVYYKSPGHCEAVEVYKPGTPVIEGIAPLGRRFDQMIDEFKVLDSSVVVEDSGLTSFLFGISLYAPFALECPEDPVEGILVFENGYYSKE